MLEKITVVIPVYNVENYLSRCVETVIKQTYTNIEIILVDDGSTDKSGKICDEYRSIDNRIIVIHQNNKGLSAARNIGIKHSTGKFITFVDSDDWLKYDFVETMYCLQNKYNADIVTTKLVRSVGFDNNKLTNKHNETIDCFFWDRDRALEAMLYRNITSNSACGKLFRTNLFNNILFPLGKLFEDFGTIYKVFFESKNVLLTTYKGYYYFYRDGSIVNSSFKKADLDFLEFAETQLDFILTNCPKCKKAAHVRYVDANQELFFKLIQSKNQKDFVKYKNIFKKNVISKRKYVFFNSACSYNLKARVLAVLFGEAFVKVFLFLKKIKLFLCKIFNQ